MWLPEEYELKELNLAKSPMLKGIYASFYNEESEVVYKLDVFNGEPAHQYYKDDTHYETYEQNGAIYNIARNNNLWVVVWTKENIECSIFVDCQEDILQRILESIYEMEDS
jgi:hypothetical protein